MISVDLRDPSAEVGGRVRGQVTWDPNQKAPDAVRVELGFVTEGRGNQDRGVVAWTEREFQGDPTTIPPWLAFDLEVPADAPVSYDGRLIRVLWWVEAHLDVPWARDPSARADLVIHPRGG